MLNKSILITGGTGSFGQAFAQYALARGAKKVVIYSRDELKQFEMARSVGDERLRFFLGDVRDSTRLLRAFTGIDIVVHAAALKQVPAAEYNPFEVIKTNVLGAQNVIDAAIDREVKQVIALSTDKACAPINLYGATKLCSDKLFMSAHHYVGKGPTRFGVVRYGNVAGSRGSIVPLFRSLVESGRLPITDLRMTRFWITLKQAVLFVTSSLERLEGGQMFVPKLPSFRVVDLAKAIGPKCNIEVIGIRPGEKLHEVMINEDELGVTEFDSHYQVRGSDPGVVIKYSSDSNSDWLDFTNGIPLD